MLEKAGLRQYAFSSWILFFISMLNALTITAMGSGNTLMHLGEVKTGILGNLCLSSVR